MTEFNKVKAITVLEVMISLIISSLVISLSYQSFQLIRQMHSTYSKKREVEESFLSFDKIFSKDFEKASLVLSDGNRKIICVLGGREIQYYFYQDYILRESGGISDTFQVVHDVEFHVFPETSMTGYPLIQKVELNSSLGDYLIPFLYQKQYSPDITLNRKLE